MSASRPSDAERLSASRLSRAEAELLAAAVALARDLCERQLSALLATETASDAFDIGKVSEAADVASDVMFNLLSTASAFRDDREARRVVERGFGASVVAELKATIERRQVVADRRERRGVGSVLASDPFVVVNTEATPAEVVGTYLRTVEDTVEYRRPDGSVGHAPEDCVAVLAPSIAAIEIAAADRRAREAAGEEPAS